jgi:hypothetical protein
VGDFSMTLSLRAYAQCIGLSPPFSVIGEFFGYTVGLPWPSDPSDPPTPAFLSKVLSLRTQMERLDGPHFPLAVVRVGDASLWNSGMESRVDLALQITREIYARAGFGIGRITRWVAPPDAPTSVDNNRLLDVLGTGSGSNLVEDYTLLKVRLMPFLCWRWEVAIQVLHRLHNRPIGPG